MHVALPGEHRMVRVTLIACLLATTPALAQQASTLKPGPDVNLVAAACGVCHTTRYIPMNATFLTPDGWAAEVTKMRKAYGAPLDDATAATVVKYLSETYAAPPKS
jgi:sulfite dehydrogenase (cytochrome) subunit B